MSSAVVLVCVMVYALPHRVLYFGDHPFALSVISPAFEHVGPLHLLFNLYWIVLVGPVLERAVGSLALVALIAGIAVASNAAQYRASGPRFMGISGVVFGLVGFAWAARSALSSVDRLHVEEYAQLFGAWFVACVLMTAANMLPIANTAHAAGAAVGLLAGVCYARLA